jgi:hypothetical protein
MKTRMLVCLLGAFLSFGATAQESSYAFRVLINKGKNEIKTGGNWTPVKVGSSVGSKDEIKVTENSYLGLVHVSGKSIELKEAKTYSVADLSAKIGQGTSVLNKYTDFILSNNAQKKNNLQATGAVHRGPGKIKIYLPGESPVVFNNKIIINWEKTDDVKGPFIVKFNSMFGDELKKEEVNGYSLTIELNDPSFEAEDNFLVQIISKPDPNKQSDPYTIKKLSKADKERIKISLKDVQSGTTEQTAINKLLLAAFYEQNGLLIDASTAYQEAIKLAPDVIQFQEDYTDFMLRNKIKDPPVKK